MGLLVIINIIAFIIELIDDKVSYGKLSYILDILTFIICTLGGALGVVLGILVLNKKANKETMMLRVYALVMLVIQACLLIFKGGFLATDLNFNIFGFIWNNKILRLYFIIINIVTVFFYGFDKLAAIKGWWRIPIVTLLLLATAGGSIAGLISMYVFNHKTSKEYFKYGVPLIILAQVILLFVVINIKF